MMNRRRRWLRRLAIGISFATFVAPAAARPDGGGASGKRVELSSISSRAILDGALAPKQAASVRPDDRADRFTGGLQQSQFVGNAVRPDDRGDRFAVSKASAAPAPVSDASVSWDGAITLGLGTLVLILALGLGIGYIRRPRIAGL